MATKEHSGGVECRDGRAAEEAARTHRPDHPSRILARLWFERQISAGVGCKDGPAAEVAARTHMLCQLSRNLT